MKVLTLDSPCHEWTGAKTKGGYGVRKINGRMHYVHRLAYEATRGPIPTGMWIDHLCRNRACHNPDHLEAVTPRENHTRGLGPALASQRQRGPSPSGVIARWRNR